MYKISRQVMKIMSFSRHLLDINPEQEAERIILFLRQNVHQIMHRRGGVLGISGGVDSSVVLALCVRAFGAENITTLLLPEKDSDPESERLGRAVAAKYGVEPILEVITPVLDGFGCYPRRDEAIRRLFPEYDGAAGYKAKIVLPQNLLDEDTLNFFSLTIVTPQGEEKTRRLPIREYSQIVAASNFKQRTRMSMLYYHAELRNYAVIGTANKNEHDQGFFVKWGDGGADIQPIVHLYKTQVYQLADYLEVPQEIRQRPPTSDTYSAACTQEEFFFRLPFNVLDVLWFAMEHQVPISEVAQEMGLEEIQVQRAFNDFTRKHRTTDYLRLPPIQLSESQTALT
jgi:NAD+ synthase